jgi:hypothetical protein
MSSSFEEYVPYLTFASTLTLRSILLSPQFTFLIGKEKKSVVVHANAIAATCSQMSVLINGNMNEANTRCAEIKEVEVEDFIRFCEYAYRGDFTVPTWKRDETWSSSPKVLPNNVKSDIPEPVSEPVPELPPVAEPEPSIPKKLMRKLKHHVTFQTRTYELVDDDPKTKIQDNFNPYTNETADQDFTPVLLAYARLYTFAHFRSIEPLKALILQKLHSTLKGFKLYHNRLGDIIKLAEYAYTADDLPNRGVNGRVDPLRRLVVEYIAWEINTIGMRREFVELLEEAGEFAGDIWGATMRGRVFFPIGKRPE